MFAQRQSPGERKLPFFAFLFLTAGFANARGAIILTVAKYIVLFFAAIPSIYYLLVLYSTVHFFRDAKRRYGQNTGFTPPVSCLKPIKNLDIEAYENYASFCRQDYPEFEIVFCVDPDDPALPVLDKLIPDFPEPPIRLLFGSAHEPLHHQLT